MKITLEFDSPTEFEQFLPLVEKMKLYGIHIDSVSIQPLETKSEKKRQLLKLLENAPTLNETELSEFKNARQLIDSWNIASF